MILIPLSSGADRTMSSLAIAEITGKPHGNVMGDIRRILDEAGIGQQDFLSSYLNSQNKSQPCFLLPRRECDLVVSGYSVKYRLAIIDRWQELEAEKANPLNALSDPESLRGLLLGYTERVIALETKVAEQAPKVEFFDTVTASDDLFDMAVAAQTAKLPFGRNTLFQKLRQEGVLFSNGKRYNLPKQEYVTSRKYFSVNQSPWTNPKTGEKGVSFTTYVTQLGIDWLIKKFGGNQGGQPA